MMANMPNPNGYPASLVPAPAGNLRSLKHGLYSPRSLEPRAREIADALMEAPWLQPFDVLGVEELASLQATLEQVDRALAEKPRGTGRKNLLDAKVRLTREMRAWAREAGLTARSRWEFAAGMSFSERVEERVREIRAEREVREHGS